MAEGSIEKDVNSLRSRISGFAAEISKQVTEVEQQLAESERENENLLEMAKSLSNKIIKTNEEKLKLLYRRDYLLCEATDDRSLLRPNKPTNVQTCGPQQSSSHQQEALSNADPNETLHRSLSQHLGEPNDSAFLKTENLTSKDKAVLLESTETLYCSSTQKLGDSNDLAIPEPKIVTSKTEEAITNEKQIDQASVNLISTGFNIFNTNRKEILRKLRQAVPKVIDQLSLTKKRQIRGLDDELIICAAGWHGILVVITKNKMLHLGYEIGQVVTMDVAKDSSCVDIQSRYEVVAGDKSGYISLVDVLTKESTMVCQFKSAVTGIKVHPNRLFVIATTSGGSWSLVDIFNHVVLRNQNTGSDVLGLDIHLNGAYVATSSIATGLRFWDLRIDQPMTTIEDVDGSTISFLVQGNWFYTCTDYGIKILDPTKYPGVTSSWRNQTSNPIGLNKVDPSGRIICVTTGNNLTVLELIRTENTDQPHIFKEILNSTTDKPVVHVDFMEQGIWFVLQSGEIHLYAYSC